MGDTLRLSDDDIPLSQKLNGVVDKKSKPHRSLSKRLSDPQDGVISENCTEIPRKSSASSPSKRCLKAVVKMEADSSADADDDNIPLSEKLKQRKSHSGLPGCRSVPMKTEGDEQADHFLNGATSPSSPQNSSGHRKRTCDVKEEHSSPEKKSKDSIETGNKVRKTEPMSPSRCAKDRGEGHANRSPLTTEDRKKLKGVKTVPKNASTSDEVRRKKSAGTGTVKSEPTEKEKLSSKKSGKSTPSKNENKRKSTGKPKDEEGPSKSKKKKVVKEEEEVWKWWEEEKKADGIRWISLAHKGPLFSPPYEPLPDHVRFLYNGKPFKLSSEAEEVATFYARMLDHEYTSKEAFNKNFFKDWRKVMNAAEEKVITDLKKCDFQEISTYFQEQREIKKAMSKEEKLKIKEEKQKEVDEYGYAMVDGHRQKIGNFRVEPPGLFRGRGGHPKMGHLKKRIQPEDVIINCAENSEIPVPPKGHTWKEVRHDNTVSWLCSWTENVLGSIKYMMLNSSSKVKGEKDFEKFEVARRLKSVVGNIRDVYTADFKSSEMRVRQRAVALYFIDKLALRAGNEKDVDEVADTVGCCSLRCEHIKLHEQLDAQENVVEFDFLGKDSIRYYNRVPVPRRVFKNLKLFMEKKEPDDDLFDRLDTTYLNQHLQKLMPGLTVKVFRTYNASITLQEQLEKLTEEESSLHERLLAYNRANRQVAILCNHQRAVPKTHEKSMENLQAKIDAKQTELKEAKRDAKKAESDNAKEKAKKRVERAKEQLQRLLLQRTDKDENKQIALSTSKLNYLDPRISVAWCKKHDVPIEKIFNKTQREKFRWAMDMADENFVF